MKISFTGNADADALLSRDPLALLVGMLLDQQVPMEWAFTSPSVLAQRLGTGDLDAAAIAAMDAGEVEAAFREKPALHRYPGNMAKRVHTLCQHLVEHHDGDAEAVWRDAATGAELLKRLRDLPGFGEQKARIFVAVLGKRLGVQPEGWREAAGAYGEEGFRSVADVVDADSLAQVRETKRQAKRSST
jgi:uncharacterized HhH-GPD family protein